MSANERGYGRMKRSESKYFNTAVRMDEALLALLEEKDFQYITVKEICEKARVNRSTFYLHYETIGDLLNETIELIMKRFDDKFQSFERITAERVADVSADRLILITPEYIMPYLAFVRENRRVFHIAISQPSAIRTNHFFNRLCADVFYPIMRRFDLDEQEIRYRLVFYLQGIFALICEWVRGGCEDPSEEIADLLIRCVFPRKELPL